MVVPEATACRKMLSIREFSSKVKEGGQLFRLDPRLCNALFLMVLEASESKLQQVRINRA